MNLLWLCLVYIQLSVVAIFRILLTAAVQVQVFSTVNHQWANLGCVSLVMIDRPMLLIFYLYHWRSWHSLWFFNSCNLVFSNFFWIFSVCKSCWTRLFTGVFSFVGSVQIMMRSPSQMFCFWVVKNFLHGWRKSVKKGLRGWIYVILWKPVYSAYAGCDRQLTRPMVKGDVLMKNYATRNEVSFEASLGYHLPLFEVFRVMLAVGIKWPRNASSRSAAPKFCSNPPPPSEEP